MASVSRGITRESAAAYQTKKRRGFRVLLPEKWLAHLILIFFCFVMGLPVLYAMIVSTQTNADVAAFRLTPGDSFYNNVNIVLVSRHLGQFMANSIVVAVAI